MCLPLPAVLRVLQVCEPLLNRQLQPLDADPPEPFDSGQPPVGSRLARLLQGVDAEVVVNPATVVPSGKRAASTR